MTKITKAHLKDFKKRIRNAKDKTLIKAYKENNWSGPTHTLIRNELLRRKRNLQKQIKLLKARN